MNGDRYPPVPPPGDDRAKLAQCLRERYEAGASIFALMRGIGAYRVIRDLLIEAGTSFRRGEARAWMTFAPRAAEDVLAEMVTGNECDCLLHSKDPWQLLSEYVEELAHNAMLRREAGHQGPRGPAVQRCGCCA